MNAIKNLVGYIGRGILGIGALVLLICVVAVIPAALEKFANAIHALAGVFK